MLRSLCIAAWISVHPRLRASCAVDVGWSLLALSAMLKLG